MIYKHKYLSQDFLNNKSIQTVNQQSPLVVLLSKKFTFLNDLVTYSLRLNHVRFQIKQTDEEEIMSYQLPAIAFKDYFLTQETLVQFIGDLMLSRQSFTDMNERKTIVKDQYRKWFELLKQQNTGLCTYSNLRQIGIQTQQDYYNHIFSQLFAMASWVKSDILERKYEGFRRNQINFEALFIYQIVKSILKLCEKTKVDHILRAHFQNLIEFHEEFKRKIDGVINSQEHQFTFNQIQIVTDKVAEVPVVEYPTFKQNWKRFAIVFTIAAGIYIKWVD